MTSSLSGTERSISEPKLGQEAIISAPVGLGLARQWLDLYKKGAAPDTVFPIDSVARIYERVAIDVKSFSKNLLRKPYVLASNIANAYFNAHYSFTDNLCTGHYAPYPHEKIELNMAGDNCTTIISEAYLFCEAFGLKPEIVQFFDFKDIKIKKDEEDLSPSHFSLIIDVSRKHRYLFDPFYNIFGPIREQGENYFTIGKCQDRPERKRTFRKILPYSAHDFVTMMDRLHDPAESLDMLIAGQRVYQARTIAGTTKCDLMIYFDDEKNTISTRLYVPQKPLTDKVVYARMALDDSGEVSKILLDGYLAKDSGWISLVDPKKVFETNFLAVRSLKRKLHTLKNQEGKKFRLSNDGCIFLALSQADERDRETLLSITDRMYQALSEEERQKLRPLIMARTLYESERVAEKYLYSSEQHDARLLEKVKYEHEENLKIRSLDNLLYLHDWKLHRLAKNELQKIKRAKSRHIEKMQDIVIEINALNNLRYYQKKAYSQAMDKVLFSEALKGQSSDDLEKIVIDRHLDTRIGYLAIVADFIPFVLEGQEDLELKSYQQPIKKKVAARMRKKAAQHLPEKLTAVSGLELAVTE